jgi:hypothetical protein
MVGEEWTWGGCQGKVSPTSTCFFCQRFGGFICIRHSFVYMPSLHVWGGMWWGDAPVAPPPSQPPLPTRPVQGVNNASTQDADFWSYQYCTEQFQEFSNDGGECVS